MNTHTAFGGKVILLRGDFRQVLPVVPRAPPAAVLDVCLKRSDLWHSLHHMSLTQNMRANANEHEFSIWLLQMGDGSIQSTLDGMAPDVIDIPERCTCNGSLISEVFDNCTAEEMKAKVILSPKNSECLAVNEEVLRMLPSENQTYLSTDSVSCDNDEEAQNYPMEFINSLIPSGMSPHRLNLKVGAIIMLLRNLSITQGLCNGTRLEVIQLHEHSIEASIISGSHTHNRVLIPRIKLNLSDVNIPFVLHRTQFPVRLSYSMTINKAQATKPPAMREVTSMIALSRQSVELCPASCRCELLGFRSLDRPLLSVDCRSAGLQTLPSVIPPLASSLIMSNNSLKNIDEVFSNPSYSRLAKCDFSNNAISSIDGAALVHYFTSRGHDVKFDLRHNQLSRFPVWELRAFYNKAHRTGEKHLPAFDLSSNPWECEDCSFSPDFKSFVYDNMFHIRDHVSVRCGGNGTRILHVDFTALCYPAQSPLLVIDVVNIFMALILLATIANFAHNCYQYRRHGKLPWVVRHCKKC
ncbi:DNA helicase Pif1-like [Trinorchestia longiramus]|nr:DNA helicase Pif1-like [Trinorchestia longiramus]